MLLWIGLRALSELAGRLLQADGRHPAPLRQQDVSEVLRFGGLEEEVRHTCDRAAHLCSHEPHCRVVAMSSRSSG